MMKRYLEILNNLPNKEEEVKNTLSDDKLLPTGKPHISFSEFYTHSECAFKHKLSYIDKLETYKDNIHALFGTQLHNACEELTKTGAIADKSRYLNEYIVKAKKVLEEQKIAVEAIEDSERKEKAKDSYEKALDNHKLFQEKFSDIADDVLPFLNEVYPGWRLEKAELNLYEMISERCPYYFKGFIDLVISIPRRKKIEILTSAPARKGTLRMSDLRQKLGLCKVSEQDFSEDAEDREVVLLDWKKTNETWSSYAKNKFEKQAQLLLYKHFFSQLTGVSLDDISCAFVLLRVDPKISKEAKEKLSESEIKKELRHCELFPIDSSEKKVKKAFASIIIMINSMKKGFFRKNKTEFNCRFCDYNMTNHCP
jgi:hypothetical protein